MGTRRYPVLIWEDYTRCFTGALVEEWTQGSACGPSAQSVLDQLEEFIHWKQREGYYPDPVLQDLKATRFSIPIRPTYTEGKKLYSCDEVFPLHVVCVHGQRPGGMHVAAIPSLDVRFIFHGAEKLKPLVEYHVKERLRHVTPRDLIKLLPAKNFYISELAVREAAPRLAANLESTMPNLSAVAEPLGSRILRRHLSKPWEREAEVLDLVKRISLERANVLLVGPTGIGKTTLLSEAVRRIESGASRGSADEHAEPAEVKHKFWMTQAGRLIAGMRYLGQWEERCEAVIAELSSIEGTLCVDNLLDLLRMGGDGPLDSIAAFCAPYLQRGELRIIAECTPEEFDACRRLLPEFADLFQILRIEPFSPAQSLKIMQLSSQSIEQTRVIAAEQGAVALIHRLFSRFRPYDAFPGNATAFLRNLFEEARRYKIDEIRKSDVLAAFVRQSGLPESFLRDEQPLDVKACEAFFRSQVIGQNAACASAVNLVTLFKSGLNDPQRPLAVLLFCGPTGVGKTELAKAIAEYLFSGGSVGTKARGGNRGEAEQRMIRLDMSEYGDAYAAERLLGTEREPSDLIKKIRRQPFTVVLLDEIEKASPDVFDMLLGVFDEGRLTDQFGRVTWFRSAVVIMTSNLGTEKQHAAGFHNERSPEYRNEALSFFRPEFFNRIDEVVSFNPLNPETIRQITIKELESITQREGIQESGVRVTWTPELVDHLASLGFDKRFGARPLQRTIERKIVAPLARYLLEKKPPKGAALILGMDTNGQIRVN